MEHQQSWRDKAKQALIAVSVINVLSVVVGLVVYTSIEDSLISVAKEIVMGFGDSPTLDRWLNSAAVLFVVFLALHLFYMFSVKQFKEVQEDENDMTSLGRVQTGVLLMIISMIAFFVVPILIYKMLGERDATFKAMLVFFFLLWILLIIAWAKVKNGFGELRVSDSYGDLGKKGAGNLTMSALCNLWMVILPVVAMILSAVIGLGTYSSARSSLRSAEGEFSLSRTNRAVEGAIDDVSSGFDLLQTLGYVFAIVMLVLLCASVVLSILGWYRIMNDGSQTVDEAETADETVTTSEAEPTCEAETSNLVAANEVPAVDEEFEEYEESHKRKWFTIGGIALAVAAVGAGAWLLLKKEPCPMEVEKPRWEQFVMMTRNDVAVHKEASASSPTLKILTVNLESDMINRVYRWDDEPEMRGYSSEIFTLSNRQVVPVLEKKGNWYKVQISSDAGLLAAWVDGGSCEEVKPEPITVDVLERVMDYENCYESYYLIEDGKYENLCFRNGYGEFDQGDFRMGVLNDGVLYFPETMPVNLNSEDTDVVSVTKHTIDQFTTVNITYGLAHQYQNGDKSCYFFDPQMLEEKDVDELFQCLKKDKPIYVEACYYFPDANDDVLYEFMYYLDGTTVDTNSSYNSSNGSQDENATVGYYVVGTSGSELIANLKSGTEQTGITSECQLEVVCADDFDADGEADAVVREHRCGGTASDAMLYVVTYLKDSKKYVKTSPFSYPADVVATDGGNGMRLYQREGVYEAEYRLENHKLKKVGEALQFKSPVLTTFTCSQFFDGSIDGYSEATANYDLNGDGQEDEISFGHSTSDYYELGAAMELRFISFGLGSWCNSPGIKVARKISVLTSTTNGMHDLMVNDHFLYRWNGDKYESYIWDGQTLVLESAE